MLYPRIEVHSLRDCALSFERDPRELHTGKGGLTLEEKAPTVADVILYLANKIGQDETYGTLAVGYPPDADTGYFQIIWNDALGYQEEAFNITVSRVV